MPFFLSKMFKKYDFYDENDKGYYGIFLQGDTFAYISTLNKVLAEKLNNRSIKGEISKE